MTRTPLVALSIYQPNEIGRVNLPTEYHEAVRRAGARPLLIPPGDPDIAGLLDLVDALVLPGGGDIEPALFDGQDHATVYGTSTLRDEFEWELTTQALAKGIPTLAICRGAQMLNVVLGGTIHPHLPDAIGETVVHRDDPPGAVLHGVEVASDSLIAKSMGATEVETASWHHQGLNELGAGLRPVAWAPDGLVEAVELDTHPFLQAVQWHPEITAATDPTQQALFDALIDSVRSDS